MATETDITGQLADYFGWLERELGTEGLRAAPRAQMPRRAPALIAASLLVIGAGVAAVAYVGHEEVRPGALAPEWSAANVGAWTMDTPPTDMRLLSAASSVGWAPDQGPDGYVVRLYATASATPETDPYVRLSSYAVGQSLEETPPGATPVALGGGVTGEQWSIGAHRHVLFQRDGYVFHIDAVGIDDPTALAASATRASDNYGAVIDATLLPAGVTERAAGTVFEIRFLSREALTQGLIGEGHWGTPGSETGIFYLSFPESPAVFALHRIEYDYSALGEVDINGRAALRTTTTDGPINSAEHTEIWWNEGGRTIMVGGYGGVTAEQVIAAARALRPATEAEWAAMTSTQPTPAPVTVATTG